MIIDHTIEKLLYENLNYWEKKKWKKIDIINYFRINFKKKNLIYVNINKEILIIMEI